jgi:hypothetical protein
LEHFLRGCVVGMRGVRRGIWTFGAFMLDK